MENEISQNDFFTWLDTSSDQDKIDFFKAEIIEILGVDEYEIKYITDEIFTSSEYMLVYFALRSGNNATRKHKERKGEFHDRKRQLERMKQRILNDIQHLSRYTSFNLDVSLKAALKTEIKKAEIDTRIYESKLRGKSLNNIKKGLFEDLTRDCETGGERAKDIIKIIDILK